MRLISSASCKDGAGCQAASMIHGLLPEMDPASICLHDRTLDSRVPLAGLFLYIRASAAFRKTALEGIPYLDFLQIRVNRPK